MTTNAERKINIGAIPSELTALRQWVLWREEIREEKLTKVPYTIRGTKASTADSTTWTDFVSALAAYKQVDMAGIGFVFTKNDPFTGVDLDKCRDLETEQIEPWAEIIMDYLNSYTELSPSGKGLHVIVEGRLPVPGRKRKELEMYSQGRFFTITGDRLEGKPKRIEERHDKLLSIYKSHFRDSTIPPSNGHAKSSITTLGDEDIIRRASIAENATKFIALWGGCAEDYPSASEADLALTSLLAFWTGPDPQRIDNLFRQSGLYRPKWDSPRNDSTYGLNTIAKALKDKEEFYQTSKDAPKNTVTGSANEDESETENQPPGTPLRYVIHWAREALQPQSEIPYAIKGLFTIGSVALIVGYEGSFKTYSLLAAGIAVAMGEEDWLTFPVTQGTVLLVDEESGLYRINKRLGDLMRGYGAEEDLPFAYVTLEGFNLLKGEDVIAIQELVAETNPRLVILDALADLMLGGDENTVQDTQPVFHALRKIAEKHQCAIVIIHHMNKQGVYRGSTAIAGAVDTLIEVQRDAQEPLVTFVSKKARDSEPFRFTARLSFGEEQIQIISADPKRKLEKFNRGQEYVMRYLGKNGPSLKTDIANRANTCAANTAIKELYNLVAHGIVERTDDGKKGASATFSLTKDGHTEFLHHWPEDLLDDENEL